MRRWVRLALAEVQQTTRVALRSSVARNAGYLYVVQFANYIVPLITVPYLVRVLGASGYGTVAFAQSLITYLVVVVEYGFPFSATRRISGQREDKTAMTRTAFSVWAAKGVLCLACLASLLLLTAVVAKLRPITALLVALYGTVFGNVLFPTWLFQGTERMATMSLVNLGLRLLTTAGVFAFVRSPDDLLTYGLVLGTGSIAAGIAGGGLAMAMFRMRPVIPTLREVREILADGLTLFAARASTALYTAANPFILGLFTSPAVVGYYSAAERIARAATGLFGPMADAAYPKLSKLAPKSRAATRMWAKRMLIGMAGVGFGASIAAVIGAPLIVRIVLGTQYAPSVAILRILAVLPAVTAISNVLGIQVMLPFGRDRSFLAIVLIAGVINVGSAALFIPLWKGPGMAASLVLTETFVTSCVVAYVRRRIFPRDRSGSLRTTEADK